jgi:hypothetical protein
MAMIVEIVDLYDGEYDDGYDVYTHSLGDDPW